MSNIQIDANTIITAGTQLSKNFILGHTSTGAFHYTLGRIVPTFTSFLLPGNSTIPGWQIVRNLQMGSQGILENMLNAFGSDLIIKSAFQGNLSNLASMAIDEIMRDSDLLTKFQKSIGTSFDIQIKGYEGNMYNVVDIVKKMSGGASSLELIYGATSAVRIGFNEASIKSAATEFQGLMRTKDVISNVVEAGLTSIIGTGS